MVATCKDCNRKLRWAWEVHQGSLCSECGPGSARYQETRNQRAADLNVDMKHGRVQYVNGPPQTATSRVEIIPAPASLASPQEVEIDDSRAKVSPLPENEAEIRRFSLLEIDELLRYMRQGKNGSRTVEQSGIAAETGNNSGK